MSKKNQKIIVQVISDRWMRINGERFALRPWNKESNPEGSVKYDVSAYQAQWAVESIARYRGVSRQTINRLMIACGVSMRP